VFKNNQKTGPFTLDVVQANLRGGVFAPTDLCWYDGLANWNPISSLPSCAPVEGPTPPGMPPITTVPPSAASPLAPAPAPPVPKARPDESLGTALVIVPVMAGALTWFWIGNMRLMDGPGSKLGLLTAATILITAALATAEASKLGTGSEADVADWSAYRSERHPGGGCGLKPPTPILWFFSFVFIWLFSYPHYLHYRGRYGLRSLLGAGLVAMILWFIPLGIIGCNLAGAQQHLERQIQQLQNYR
jgi:hypothetical protein